MPPQEQGFRGHPYCVPCLVQPTHFPHLRGALQALALPNSEPEVLDLFNYEDIWEDARMGEVLEYTYSQRGLQLPECIRFVGFPACIEHFKGE